MTHPDHDPNALSVSAARAHINAQLSAVTATERLALKSALRRVLAAPVVAPMDVPSHANSAMDGYALNANEQSPHRRLVGTVLAGHPLSHAIQGDECVRIMTGGLLPVGANAVIKQEQTRCDGNQVSFSALVKVGDNVRQVGEDLQRGQTVLGAGRLLSPTDIGLIASLGIAELSVWRRLRVAFFSTGDELVGVGQSLQDGQLYDSNRYTLHSMLSRLGVMLDDLGAIPDQPEQLERALLLASQNYDVVISSGGVSVGEADYMKALLAQHGHIAFWKVNMKPGRPLAFGRLGQAYYFGLPGNPVAVIVTFYQLVREALLRLMGQTPPQALPLLRVECVSTLNKQKGRTEFQRGILFADDDGIWKVKSSGAQGSAILSAMSAANCFIVLDENTGTVAAHSMVVVQVLEGLV